MQLRPEVEKHRKGKGPKRERCVSYWDEDIIGRGTVGVTAGTHEGDGNGGGDQQAALGEEGKGGLEMVEMRNGKVVLREREVEVDIFEVEHGGEEEGKGFRDADVDVDEEAERGRERRLEFMVGKRGRGFD